MGLSVVKVFTFPKFPDKLFMKEKSGELPEPEKGFTTLLKTWHEQAEMVRSVQFWKINPAKAKTISSIVSIHRTINWRNLVLSLMNRA